MRALKTILGSPLIDEKTSLGSRMVPLTEVVGIFVRHLKHKAEAFAGQEITAVVHGRPVHFVDGDAEADARAQAVLETIAREAGFRHVVFVPEPIAAAWHYEQTVQAEELVLIADIGGGTSDFSVVRIGPQRRGRIDRTRGHPGDGRRARRRHGFRQRAQPCRRDAAAGPRHAAGREGPADAERALSRARDLGDDQLRLHLQERARGRRAGPGGVRAGQGRPAADGDRQAPGPPRRLRGRGRQDRAQRRATMPPCPSTSSRTSLAATATRAGFERAIRTRTDRLYRTARDCIAAADLDGAAIDTVFLTGGSSRVPAVRAAIAEAAPAHGWPRGRTCSPSRQD